MRHFFKGPGKLFRPQLLLASHATFATPNPLAYQAALAIECIHIFSLVHDDLPDMDDADTRRHMPTVHTVYGNAQAILAGDALMNLGFDVLAHANGTPEQCLSMIKTLTRAIGHQGMTLGQSMDMGQLNNVDALIRCYELKTGALIAASCLKMISAGIEDTRIHKQLQALGHHIGLFFQIQDDLFDYNDDTTGKTKQPNQSNLVAQLGYDECQSLIEAHQEKALTLIEALPNPKPLNELLQQYLVRQC